MNSKLNIKDYTVKNLEDKNKELFYKFNALQND